MKENSSHKVTVVSSISELKQIRSRIQNANIGFVPTMGALHLGHKSLFLKARSENDVVIASIFVNPTQFNDKSDLEKYPRTLDADLEVLAAANVDYVFTPKYEEIYFDDYRYKVSENQISLILEGEHRPGHFDGVLTVVLKLFNLVKATRAYFGEKDYQQYLLIKKMAEALFLETQVIPVPTVRESSGLAMSSRNTRLSEQGRKSAALIYKQICNAPTSQEAIAVLSLSGFKVDYVTDLELEDGKKRRLVAAFLENVRLIDNVEIK